MTTIAMKFGGYQRPASILNRATEIFGKALVERLGDAVSFHLDGDFNEAGRITQNLPELVEVGTYTGCYMNMSAFSNEIPETQVLEIPFSVESRGKIYAALDGELGAILRDRIEATRALKLMALWDNGFRYFSNRIRPILTPADCRGICMRTHSSTIYAETFALLGFVPVPVRISDLPAALEEQSIDAQENPLTNLYNFGIHKYRRYVTMSAPLWGAVGFFINRDAYDSWPEHVQSAVDAAAFEATFAQRKMASAEDDRIRQILDPDQNELVELTPRQRQAFKDAVAPIIDRQRAAIGPELCAYLD